MESHRDNIASTLRSGNRSGDFGLWSNPGGEEDEEAHQSFGPDGAAPPATGSYLAAEESDIASATSSSDNDSVIDTTDLVGLSSAQAEELWQVPTCEEVLATLHRKTSPHLAPGVATKGQGKRE